MINESAVDSGKRISEYVSNIKKGYILTRKISDKAKRHFGFSRDSNLKLFVSDRNAHKRDKVEKIAEASLDITYDVIKKLKEAGQAKKDFDVNGTSLAIDIKAEPSFYGFLFAEGPLHIRIHPNPPNNHNQYDMQLNFREIEIGKQPKLAVIVESIHKGYGQEFHLRQKARNQNKSMSEANLKDDEVEDYKAITDANAQLAGIEKSLGCSMSELSFQTALAFARGVGADIFMATDDAFVSTKQHYEQLGATKIYSPNNWIFQKNGLLPPREGEYFWINPYPNRLQSEETSLQDSLFFYANTNVSPPDRYRNFPKGVSTPAIQKILVPFENNLRTVFKGK